MQTYDLLMLLVLAAATMFGFWKGMAWQVASLASLVVSGFVAWRFADQLAPMFGEHSPWNKSVAMLAIYIGTSFVIWNLFRLVSGMIDRVKLDGFDHQMGAIIGFAKGVLLTIAITFFAVTILPQNQKDMIIASRTGEYIVRLLDKAHTVVPPDIHAVIHPYVERIEQRLDPNYQPHSETGLLDQWPPLQVPNWPSQADKPSTWPEQQPAAPSQQPPPSVYDRSTWPPEQPSSQPATPWPPESQTADRPSGKPI